MRQTYGRIYQLGDGSESDSPFCIYNAHITGFDTVQIRTLRWDDSPTMEVNDGHRTIGARNDAAIKAMPHAGAGVRELHKLVREGKVRQIKIGKYAKYSVASLILTNPHALQVRVIQRLHLHGVTAQLNCFTQQPARLVLVAQHTGVTRHIVPDELLLLERVQCRL